MNKYTKAMPKIRASALYKSLCAVFREEDHAELLRQLTWAYVDYKYPHTFKLNEPDLSAAFTWLRTPQGHRFWSSVWSAILTHEDTP